VVKTAFERRDERLTAHRQLELASQRTSFVTEWLAACRSAGAEDADFAASASTRARAELEEAFEEAQLAVAHTHSVLTRSASKTFAQQCASILMLVRRRRVISYVLVAGFYAVIIPLWLSSMSSDPKTIDGQPNEEYWAWWQYAIQAAAVTVVLRPIVGVLVGWLEDRAGRAGQRSLPPPTDVPAPPVATPETKRPPEEARPKGLRVD
jgi:hypothetical protein